jgi:hypothetical protein
MATSFTNKSKTNVENDDCSNTLTYCITIKITQGKIIVHASDGFKKELFKF